MTEFGSRGVIQSDSAVRIDFTVHFWGPESVQLSNNEVLDWEKYFSTDRYPDIPTYIMYHNFSFIPFINLSTFEPLLRYSFD